MENNKQELQIDFNPELEDGVYSNLALITHSSAEFIFDFLRMTPNRQKPKLATRVVIAPEHAKRLLFALQDNINKYETQFGTIRMAGDSKPTINLADLAGGSKS